MIIYLIEKILLNLGLAALLCCLLQGRFEHDSDRKRRQTLIIAAVILASFILLKATQTFRWPWPLPAAVVFGAAAFLFNNRRSIKKSNRFHLCCQNCRQKLSFREILLLDRSDCRICRPNGQAAGRDDNAAAPRAKIDDIDWSSWQADEQAVVCYISDNDKLLLIHKKRGLGAGKINAPGGRLEANESFQAAAIRECREEVGLTPHEPEMRVELYFHFISGYKLYGQAFFSDKYSGRLQESDEALPFWVFKNAIPYDKMWQDDRYWLSAALNGEKLRGWFIFDDDRMVDMKIEKT